MEGIQDNLLRFVPDIPGLLASFGCRFSCIFDFSISSLIVASRCVLLVHQRYWSWISAVLKGPVLRLLIGHFELLTNLLTHAPTRMTFLKPWASKSLSIRSSSRVIAVARILFITFDSASISGLDSIIGKFGHFSESLSHSGPFAHNSLFTGLPPRLPISAGLCSVGT